MFQRMSVPVLGVVENMTAFACPHCGELTEIFGRGGGERFARPTGLGDLWGGPAAGPWGCGLPPPQPGRSSPSPEPAELGRALSVVWVPGSGRRPLLRSMR